MLRMFWNFTFLVHGLKYLDVCVDGVNYLSMYLVWYIFMSYLFLWLKLIVLKLWSYGLDMPSPRLIHTTWLLFTKYLYIYIWTQNGYVQRMPHLIWFKCLKILTNMKIVQFKCLSGKVNGFLKKCLAFLNTKTLQYLIIFVILKQIVTICCKMFPNEHLFNKTMTKIWIGRIII
jgi:hypothetical protein